MNAASLGTDLVGLGVDCDVEARERLAIVRPQSDVGQFARAETRAAVVRAARLHGFTHVAVEIVGADDAPLPRA